MNANARQMTAAQAVREFGQFTAAIRRTAGVPTVRFLVVTDPATQILEGDAVQIEIADPDGTVWDAAGKANNENLRHQAIEDGVADVTLAELLTGYRREIPAFDAMDLFRNAR